MRTISISQATQADISELVSAVEAGERIGMLRDGRVVAELVSATELAELRQAREMLRDGALIMTRLASDSGVRTDLDQAMATFGVDRAELEENEGGLHKE